MRMNDAFPSKYLKAADLQGKNVKVTIKLVNIEKIGDDHKLVLYFEGADKGMVCNKTNAKKIASAYGDETDEWPGNDIVLYEAEVDFQGDTVPAIRVRIPTKPIVATAKPATAPVQRDDMDDEIPF